MRRSLSLLLAVSLLIAPGTASAKPPAVEPDIVYGHKDGMALTMDLFRPTAEPNGAAVLFMVSGGWYSKWKPPQESRWLFLPFLTNGYSVFAVRHGSSPRYTIPEAVADVRLATRFVRNHADRWGIDPERLGALGASAGGHLALMLATTGDDGDPDAEDPLGRTPSRVAAVSALVPPTDLRVAVWSAPESLPAYRKFPALDLPMDQAAEQSPLLHVTPDDAPALVIMGGRDELVPKRHGEWIEAALKREGVTHKLIVYPNAGHSLEDLFPNALMETINWFNEHLANRP